MPPLVCSFPPISRRDARVLILGTMPSLASLAARQFYGHRQNAFWRIMGELFDAGLDRPYAERTRRLKARRVAVWDVLQQCEREGSLDSNILRTSEVPNDFVAFFARHRQIRAIFFNGSKAESSFMKLVLPIMEERLEGIPRERLPSTSPANATFSFPAKLASWRRVLEFLDDSV
jgi:double-stranded uracil-DNA glycosylase